MRARKKEMSRKLKNKACRKETAMSFISVPTLYIYVPTCPACGSPRTGRYVRMTPFTEEYTRFEALRYGEIIEPAGNLKHLEGELFCLTCGNIWRGKIEKRRLSPFELAREKELRGTTQLYEIACRKSGKNPERRRDKKGLRRFFTFLTGM